MSFGIDVGKSGDYKKIVICLTQQLTYWGNNGIKSQQSARRGNR